MKLPHRVPCSHASPSRLYLPSFPMGLEEGLSHRLVRRSIQALREPPVDQLFGRRPIPVHTRACGSPVTYYACEYASSKPLLSHCSSHMHACAVPTPERFWLARAHACLRAHRML